MPASFRLRLLSLFLLLGLTATDVAAQRPAKTRILFLLDASGSMFAQMDKTRNRMDVAKKLLSKVLDSLSNFKNVEVALRIYGHQSAITEQNCKDTKLEVPFRPNNHHDIKKKLAAVVPRGTTLIAYSLTQAGNDFPDKNARNIIILLTDGLEECKGDPCAVSEALQKNGVTLRPFIIGIGASEEFRKAFECVGRYYDATTEYAFSQALNVVIAQALNSTTVQVNLLDTYGKPSETNANMSFYDSKTGQLLYNYVHAINDRGYPDTVSIDPTVTYDIVVHTMPPVKKEGVELNPGKHNIIGIDAPQGYLKLICEGMTNYSRLECIVRKPGEGQTLCIQDFNTTRKMITGKYDLEILSTPRIKTHVQINQNMIASISIPQPGRLNIAAGWDVWGSIYHMVGNNLEWVCDVELQNRTQMIIMQPGIYKIVYRPKNQNRTYFTFEKEFRIASGLSTPITL